MTARSANNVLENVTRGIIRTTMPKLPPVLGFEGHDDYMTQVRLWKSWIRWEKDDPLDLQDGDRATYNKRIIYLYKQALMPLRFWPGLWYEAAEWCFLNDLETDGNWFLEQGVEANPESCLLAFRHAHQIELKPVDEGEAGVIRKGEAVRAPFNKVLDELYELTNKTKKREEFSLARAKEAFAAQQAAEELAARKNENDEDDEDDTEANVKRQKEKEAAFQTQLQAISAGYNGQIMELKRMISYAWIALMRTMRRVQGKGRPDAPKGTPPGFRGIFAEARKKGKLLSDAYVASALIEHHCYQDPAATKIFDRGMKLFPDDEQFALEYIKHLVKQNDATSKYLFTKAICSC
jgi:cleavage stimulation factor subunit 3